VMARSLSLREVLQPTDFATRRRGVKAFRRALGYRTRALLARDLWVRSSTGARIYVNWNDARAVEMWWSGGNVNPPALEMWRRLVAAASWDLIVDVGANYGEMLFNVALPSGARVVALEPNPLVLACLVRTISESGVPVVPVVQAASNCCSIAPFLIDLRWSGSSSLRPGATAFPTQEIQVATTTVDELAASLSPVSIDDASVLVKVDVEGNELAVLEGLTDTAARARLFVGMLEIDHLTPEELTPLRDRFDVYLADGAGTNFLRFDAPAGHSLFDFAADHGRYHADAVIARAADRAVLSHALGIGC